MVLWRGWVECDQGCAATSQRCTDGVEQSPDDVLHRHCHYRRRHSDRESPPEHRAGRNTAVVIPKLRSNDLVVRNAALEQPEEGRGGPQDQRIRPSLFNQLAWFAVRQGRAAPWQNEEVREKLAGFALHRGCLRYHLRPIAHTYVVMSNANVGRDADFSSGLAERLEELRWTRSVRKWASSVFGL